MTFTWVETIEQGSDGPLSIWDIYDDEDYCLIEVIRHGR